MSRWPSLENGPETAICFSMFIKPLFTSRLLLTLWNTHHCVSKEQLWRQSKFFGVHISGDRLRTLNTIHQKWPAVPSAHVEMVIKSDQFQVLKPYSEKWKQLKRSLGFFYQPLMSLTTTAASLRPETLWMIPRTSVMTSHLDTLFTGRVRILNTRWPTHAVGHFYHFKALVFFLPIITQYWC